MSPAEAVRRPLPPEQEDRSEHRRTILVVDDEDDVRTLLGRWLEACGYCVVPARRADEALRRLETTPCAVVISDIRMPGQDGLWLTAQIRQRFPETAVIVASGVQDVEASLESMRYGVLDYLVKPFGRDRLRDAVRHALGWHQAACEARRWRETLERDVDARKARLCEAVGALTIQQDEAVDAMLGTLAAGRRDACRHGRRVATLARAAGAELGFGGAALDLLARAALLHDVGKLALPDALLDKPAPLTAEEHAVVRTFPQVGADVLGTVPYLASAARLVRDAQERVDGHGYPRGVRALELSLGARILGVADAFDTMIHPRPFRDPLSPVTARLELERCAGTQFDAAVVQAFLQAVPIR